MRLKTFKLVLLTLLLGTSINNFPAKAMEPTECTTEQYLLDHGHSPEISRMVTLQKERAEGKVHKRTQSENKFKKVLKNLWYEEDATLSIKDFGYNDIHSVETDKDFGPKIIDTKNAVLNVQAKVIDAAHKTADYIKKDKNKPVDSSNEVNVSDLKAKETK